MIWNDQVTLISGPGCSLQHGSVFSSGYMRRELITIMASISTHVTLKRVTKAMATHVNSEHHVIQEEDSAVVTPVHIRHLPFFVDHFDGVSWAHSCYVSCWVQNIVEGEISFIILTVSERLRYYSDEHLQRSCNRQK